MENTKKTKNYWLWILGCLGLFIFGGSLLLNLFLVASLLKKNTLGLAQKPLLDEIVVEGESEVKEKVAIIDILGPVFLSSESWSSLILKKTSVEFILEELRQASNDRDVKAIVLNISSPGGSITASDEIYNEVKKAKENGKKVITYFGEMGTSGAYYLACPSDKIFANPTSILGSIGVIVTSLNIEELYNKIGIKEQIIKSGKHKDLLSQTRPMTSEEQEIVQKMIDENQKRFVDIVKENRKLDLNKLDEITDGRIFTPLQAKDLGLIDDSGYLSDAVASAIELSKISEAKIIRYKIPFSWDLLFSQFEALSPSNFLVNNLSKFLISNQPKVLFLWK
jgi:protease-4